MSKEMSESLKKYLAYIYNLLDKENLNIITFRISSKRIYINDNSYKNVILFIRHLTGH